MKGLIELTYQTNDHIAKAASHNVKQQNIQSAMLEHSLNGTSDCAPLKEVVVNDDQIIALLTSAMKNTQPMETLDITPFEDDFINKAMENPGMWNDAVVNLLQSRHVCQDAQLL